MSGLRTSKLQLLTMNPGDNTASKELAGWRRQELPEDTNRDSGDMHLSLPLLFSMMMQDYHSHSHINIFLSLKSTFYLKFTESAVKRNHFLCVCICGSYHTIRIRIKIRIRNLYCHCKKKKYKIVAALEWRYSMVYIIEGVMVAHHCWVTEPDRLRTALKDLFCHLLAPPRKY